MKKLSQNRPHFDSKRSSERAFRRPFVLHRIFTRNPLRDFSALRARRQRRRSKCLTVFCQTTFLQSCLPNQRQRYIGVHRQQAVGGGGLVAGFDAAQVFVPEQRQVQAARGAAIVQNAVRCALDVRLLGVGQAAGFGVVFRHVVRCGTAVVRGFGGQLKS